MNSQRKLRWFGHVSRSSGLTKTILQGTLIGQSRDRQKKGWEYNIKEGQEYTLPAQLGQLKSSQGGKGWLHGWLVGCFGFNGPLRIFQYISSRLPKRGRKRRERIVESKNVQTTPTRTYCERSRPLPYCIQIVGRPGTGNLPSTIAPPDHPGDGCKFFCDAPTTVQGYGIE